MAKNTITEETEYIIKPVLDNIKNNIHDIYDRGNDDGYENGLRDASKYIERLYEFNSDIKRKLFASASFHFIIKNISLSEIISKIKDFDESKKHNCRNCELGDKNSLDTSHICHYCINYSKWREKETENDSSNYNKKIEYNDAKVGDKVRILVNSREGFPVGTIGVITSIKKIHEFDKFPYEITINNDNGDIKEYCHYSREMFEVIKDDDIEPIKIGDEVYVHGYVDEIRKDVMIIRNEGGYFGADKSEITKQIK